jgi:hypothetical protein
VGDPGNIPCDKDELDGFLTFTYVLIYYYILNPLPPLGGDGENI